MAEVMSYERWMKFTYGGLTSRRSGTLAELDRALEQFHEHPSIANLDILKRRLDAWIAEKGPTWKASVRNRRHAVEHLYLQVHESPLVGRRLIRPITIRTPSGNVTWTGEDAEKFVELERETFVNTCFKGKTLTWRVGYLAKLGQQKLGAITGTVTLVRTGREVYHSLHHGSGHSRAATWARDIISSIAPPSILGDVTHALESVLPDFITHLAAELTPLVGVISSGGSAAWGLFKTMVAANRVGDANVHAEKAVFEEGSPAEAVQALVRLLDRELNNELIGVAINSTAFVAKAGALAAGDPAVVNTIAGVAAAVAKLTNIIRIIVRDVLERNAANKLMVAGDVDLSIFDECPVVGAYYIALAPKSALLNIVASKYGTLGWMDDAERLIERHINPLQEQAVRIVRAHRFVILELQDFAGLKEKNDKKLKEMRNRAGKSNMTGISSESVEHEVEEPSVP